MSSGCPVWYVLVSRLTTSIRSTPEILTVPHHEAKLRLTKLPSTLKICGDSYMKGKKFAKKRDFLGNITNHRTCVEDLVESHSAPLLKRHELGALYWRKKVGCWEARKWQPHPPSALKLKYNQISVNTLFGAHMPKHHIFVSQGPPHLHGLPVYSGGTEFRGPQLPMRLLTP